MSNETISLLADLAIALSFVIGLIFGIAQIRSASRDRRERLTLETLRQFQTREFAELMTFINAKKLPLTQKEFDSIDTNDRAKYIQFGQEMEVLGILVAEKLINLDLVDKILGSYVTTSWDKYKTVYTDIREKAPDPFLGEYFQWLAERIEDRMKKDPRRPYFEDHS